MGCFFKFLVTKKIPKGLCSLLVIFYWQPYTKILLWELSKHQNMASLLIPPRYYNWMFTCHWNSNGVPHWFSHAPLDFQWAIGFPMGKGHWNSHGLVLSQAWKRADFYGSRRGGSYGSSAPLIRSFSSLGKFDSDFPLGSDVNSTLLFSLY